MRTNSSTQQLANPAAVSITRSQAIRLIEALVLCFGTQSFRLIGVLAHRSVIDFKEISKFEFDELDAGVKLALSMAVKAPPSHVIPGALYYEVGQIFGDVQGPIWFKIGNGSYHQFDPNAPL